MAIVIRKVVVFMCNLNQFLIEGGMSNEFSLLDIVCETPLPSFNNFSLDFGTSAEVFEDNELLSSTN